MDLKYKIKLNDSNSWTPGRLEASKKDNQYIHSLILLLYDSSVSQVFHEAEHL